MHSDCVYNAACPLVPAAAGEHGAGGAVRAEIVDAVDREKIGEPGARSIDATLDRAPRADANRRRVIVGKAGGAYQDKGLALVRRQLGQGSAEFLELHAPGLFGM